MRRAVSGTVLTLLLIGMLTLAFNVAVLKPVLADSLDLTDVALEMSEEWANASVYSVFCSDVDGDGDVEIVTGGQTEVSPYEGVLRVWRWNGTDLTLEIEYTLSDSLIRSVFAEDVDADGDMEIITAEQISFAEGVLRVWRWNGTDLSMETYEFWVAGYSVFCSDVDGDGDIEIVVGGSFDLAIFRWNGTTLTQETSTSAGAASVFCGDVDGDGDVEIVACERYPSSYIRIWCWDGTTLTLEIEKEVLNLVGYKYWSYIESVLAEDVDADGDVEIITGGFRKDQIDPIMPIFRYSCELLVWRSNGTDLTLETSARWRQISQVPSVMSVSCGDVDDDGDVEIVTGAWLIDDDKAQLRSWSKRDDALMLENYINWDGFVRSVFCGDVDGDGRTEIVTGGKVVLTAQFRIWSILPRPPLLPLTLEVSHEWSWYGDTLVYSVCVGDVDSDGVKEIITGGTDHFNGMLGVWNWNGTTLTLEKSEEWSLAGPTVVYSVCVDDVDGDGDVEILTGGKAYDGTSYVGQLRVWSWNGTTLTLEKSEEWDSTPRDTVVYSVSAGDVDDDGDVEILTGGKAYRAGYYRGQLLIWNWNGTTLTQEGSEDVWFGGGDAILYSVCAGDVDSDGVKERIAGGTDNFRGFLGVWFKWDLWQLHSERETVVYSICVGDVDGDGDVEIVTGGLADDRTCDNAQLRVYHVTGGKPILEISKEWATIGHTKINSVCVGDVDGDGDVEIVTGGSHQLRVWRWDGATLTLETSKEWTYDRVNSVFCGDVDDDGEMEIVTGGLRHNKAQLRIWSYAHAHLVVRGLDNRIYYRIYNSSTDSWGSWNALPTGLTCDSPAAAVYSGKLYIVVRGMDGHSLWFGRINLIDNSFSGWNSLSGATGSVPTLVGYDSQLILVVRGLDNRIYYRLYDCAAASWDSWNAISVGATCDNPAAAVLDDELHIVVRGFSTTAVHGNHSLWHGAVNLTTGIFSGWTWLPGLTPSAPTLTTSQTLNRLYLLVRGLDNRIYYNTWNGVGWEGWTALPTGATCDSPAATILIEQLHIVVRSTTGTTLWHYNINLSTKDHSGWTGISGATPSEPTLTS